MRETGLLHETRQDVPGTVMPSARNPETTRCTVPRRPGRLFSRGAHPVLLALDAGRRIRCQLVPVPPMIAVGYAPPVPAHVVAADPKLIGEGIPAPRQAEPAGPVTLPVAPGTAVDPPRGQRLSPCPGLEAGAGDFQRQAGRRNPLSGGVVSRRGGDR